MDVKERIRELMEARGWTQYKLSKESGVAWSTIRNMFERNTEPTMPTVEALCSGLGITLTELMLGVGAEGLTKEQQELITLWESLDDADRRLTLELMKSLSRKNAKFKENAKKYSPA